MIRAARAVYGLVVMVTVMWWLWWLLWCEVLACVCHVIGVWLACSTAAAVAALRVLW